MTTSKRYAILRTDKIKTRSELRRSLMHGFREQDTPNAEESLTPMNTHIGGKNTDAVMQDFEKRLETQSKIRKNAVLAVEYLITASPEALESKSREDQDKYFNDALGWLHERHGKENVIHAGVHRDETSPHMYAYVVPIDPKGKLNCRHFQGGKKDVLSEIQTDFYEKVGKKNDLERGKKGSKARHARISEYYKNINSDSVDLEKVDIDLEPKVLEKSFFRETVEGDEAVKHRVKSQVVEALAPDLERGKVAAIEKARAEQLEQTAKQLSRKVEQIEKAGAGLSQDEITQALSKARREKEQRQALEKVQEAEKKAARRAHFRKRGREQGQGR